MLAEHHHRCRVLWIGSGVLGRKALMFRDHTMQGGPPTSYKYGYNSIYRGYNPSYPIIRPFIRVITPFITGRGPPCGIPIQRHISCSNWGFSIVMLVFDVFECLCLGVV